VRYDCSPRASYLLPTAGSLAAPLRIFEKTFEQQNDKLRSVAHNFSFQFNSIRYMCLWRPRPPASPVSCVLAGCRSVPG
jgi:hypothetical protein